MAAVRLVAGLAALGALAALAPAVRAEHAAPRTHVAVFDSVA